MTESGSCIFTGTDGYELSLRRCVDLVVARPHKFQSRLTWVQLPNLRLIWAREQVQRIAYVSLPPEQIVVSFGTQRKSPIAYNGRTLAFGDLVFHGIGERFHHRTTAPAEWGSISLSPLVLAKFSQAITGSVLAPPPRGQILTPCRGDTRQFVRAYIRGVRIAEKDLDRIRHPEIARALDQDLIFSLVMCLASGKRSSDEQVLEHRRQVLCRFETAVAANFHQAMSTSELCDLVGEPQQSFEDCCRTSLGMGAAEYHRLHRLKRVHAELLRARRTKTEVAEVIERFGFLSIDSFLGEYSAAYGETPVPA